MLNRRVVVVSLPLAGLVTPILLAQPQPKVLGILSPYSSPDIEQNVDVFMRAMRDLGYTKGKEFVVVERLAEGRNERLPELAAELVKLKVDLILASSTNAVVAAQRATTSIPIVFDGVADPVLAGFADSLSHPGHNMTGLANFAIDLVPKRLQLLKQMVPSLTSVAVLTNSTNPYYETLVPRIRAAAEQLGLRAQIVSASSPAELEPAFEAIVRQRAQAVSIGADAYLSAQRKRIAELAIRFRLPSMFPFAGGVEAGGLMSYGVDTLETIRKMATYVDRIFKGARPGELPIEQSTLVGLAINRKTAQILQLTIPRELLVQAQMIVE